jgi:hypothetical protein
MGMRWRKSLQHLSRSEADDRDRSLDSKSRVDYDLGYSGLELRTPKNIDKPFGKRLSPMS